MNVLIADDEPEIAEVLEYLVKDKFFGEVITFVVSGGNEAIEILKNNKIDICISDHSMPRGNGSNILKYIIENNSTTSFVLCTTVLAEEMSHEYPLDRVFFNIVKPKIVDGIKILADRLEKMKS